jgi:hypothetical protein
MCYNYEVLKLWSHNIRVAFQNTTFKQLVYKNLKEAYPSLELLQQILVYKILLKCCINTFSES